MKERIIKSKIFISRLYIPLLLLIILSPNCAKKPVKKETAAATITYNEPSELLKKIEAVNDNSPGSFSLDLSVNGISKGKKFKSAGKAEFIKNPRRMKISFFDAIFRTTLTVIVQDTESLKLYFPYEKTLYLENIKTIDLKNYSNINLDYNIIAELTAGRIPLIEDYSVNKAIINDKNGGEDINIILENNNFFETIAFKNNIPNKLLILNKNTNERLEIHLKNPLKDANTLFFKEIQFISENPDFNIKTEFSNIKFNINPDTEKILKIDLPKEYKIINTE